MKNMCIGFEDGVFPENRMMTFNMELLDGKMFPVILDLERGAVIIEDLTIPFNNCGPLATRADTVLYSEGFKRRAIAKIGVDNLAEVGCRLLAGIWDNLFIPWGVSDRTPGDMLSKFDCVPRQVSILQDSTEVLFYVHKDIQDNILFYSRDGQEGFSLSPDKISTMYMDDRLSDVDPVEYLRSVGNCLIQYSNFDKKGVFSGKERAKVLIEKFNLGPSGLFTS